MTPFHRYGPPAYRLPCHNKLLFTIKFPQIPGFQFIDLRKIGGLVDHGAKLGNPDFYRNYDYL